MQLPAQYAIPLQSTTPRPAQVGTPAASDPSKSTPSSSSSSSHRAEHILRRKTPNGTLAAGYDGASIEWNAKPHAMKHILLPLPDASGPCTPQPVASPAHGLGIAYGQERVVSVAPYQHQSGTTTPAGWEQAPSGPDHQAWKDGVMSWVGLDSQYARGMDSMLNQGSTTSQPSSFYHPNGAHVPAILQPFHQPSLGPTASNREGPYGPYWPDGVFIPYRPAALRDPRYAYSHGSPRWNGDETFAQAAAQLNIAPWTPSTGPALTANGVAARGLHLPPGHAPIHAPPGIRSYSFPGTPSVHDSHDGTAHFQQADARASELLASDSSHARTSYPSYQMHHGTNLHVGSTTPGPSPKETFVSDFDAALSIGGVDGIPHGPEQSQFKDRLLAWAHKVYVDLLASLHQARMNSNNGSAHGGHSQFRLPKPGIYPKPPRQRSIQFPGHTADGRPSSEHASSPRSSTHLGRLQGTGLHKPGSHQARSDHHMLGQPYRQLEGRGPSAHRTAAVHGAPRAVERHLSADMVHQRRPQSRFQPPNGLENVRPQQLSPATVTANAVSALDMISKLCVESAWSWIDGMLLAGCLAYGLGNFNDAMGWYSRILDVDRYHVEAISNLAATLLSLNRREEAEQHWLRSVKLRPSYFEAVEHLIGLLCNDHRGKEAVNIIQFVERSLRYARPGESFRPVEHGSETASDASCCSSIATSETSHRPTFDYDLDNEGPFARETRACIGQPGFGSSGYAIPGSENGRILALVHAKGNMLYALGDNSGAARAFEDVVLIAAGNRSQGIEGLIRRILCRMASESPNGAASPVDGGHPPEPVLLTPDKALQTAKLVFPNNGQLPGLACIPDGMSKRAAISTTSNSLLSLAKIFQDGLSSGASDGPKTSSGVRDILALYYLSLALHPSPSTANNVGILLASVQQPASARRTPQPTSSQMPDIPGVVPGSGIALALSYYNYGLNLDSRHAHLFTNLGSLLKDIGQLNAAVKMYEQAVSCDGNFDIALANLANAVKDQGRISDAIRYYRRAVAASPDFAEAVCGLANALNSVCGWPGRGGSPTRERWHVDDNGMLVDARASGGANAGWMKRVVDIVEKQLAQGELWGRGILSDDMAHCLLEQLELADTGDRWSSERRHGMEVTLKRWAGSAREGAKIVRLVERAVKRLGWQWYQDRYRRRRPHSPSRYTRPKLPPTLSVPAAPTVLPFHTFTCPLSAKQIRRISERNALRISCSTLRSHWLPSTVFRPPAPPSPHLNVGYVSSDFNNHPLAHLMQSAFGMHDPRRVKAFCYATTASDRSVHRQQIEREAPVFRDASHWPAERIVKQIVDDGIHILVNLNGYTRGARNEIFAARPAPIQMSFMGFAGTLGAEWCDYLFADETAVPLDTLRPWRRNVDLGDQTCGEQEDSENEEWVYSENIIFARDTFFCCDHRQSAPDAQERQLSWDQEQARRWAMRRDLFPTLPDDTIILANFNQLYKIDPGTFRTWLRILSRVPRAVLWLLRFPDLGESHLKRTAELWAGHEVASRVIFTDVAPKHQHISRARVCDLFLDTPECNAHTTAADVLWSGTPLLTLPRHRYKMCSRMAASILKGALPKTEDGARAATELIAETENDYEDRAVRLGNGLEYDMHPQRGGRGRGRLSELRRLLYESRFTSALFDTRRWVRDLEVAYERAWRKWEAGEGGDIWL